MYRVYRVASTLAINTLKWKNLMYTKADKGNSIFILDKEDYTQEIEIEQYLEIKKNTLTKCKNSFHSVLRNVKVIPDKDKYLVKVNNQTYQEFMITKDT